MSGPLAAMAVLLVDKPAGCTSHDVVAIARGALGTAKVGHAGTLDPFATGLLVLGIGRATRLLEYLVGLAKEYDATARLGIATDSLDPDGRRVLEDDNWRRIDTAKLAEVVSGMVGPLVQTPPRLSAVKVRGVPAHRRVRRGEEVELPPRIVTVHSLELREADLPEIRFRVACSTGTYVRVLAEELGRRLGTASHLTALRRIRVGDFHVDRAASLASLRAGSVPDHAWVHAAAAVSHMRRVEVDPDEAAMLSAGRPIRTDAPDAGTAAMLLRGEELVAVGAVRDGMIRPRKVFLHA